MEKKFRQKNNCGYKTAIAQPSSFIENGWPRDSCSITTSFLTWKKSPSFYLVKIITNILQKIDIEKNEAINPLTEKIDSDWIELCDNLNLHYNNQTFLVKADHFSVYRVTGICQKNIFFW